MSAMGQFGLLHFLSVVLCGVKGLVSECRTCG